MGVSATNLIQEYRLSLGDTPTHKVYFYTLTSIETFFIEKDIDDFPVDIMEQVVKWMKAREYSAATIKRSMTVFRNMMKWGELKEMAPPGTLDRLKLHYELMVHDRHVFKRRQVNHDDIETLLAFVPEEAKPRIRTARTTAIIHMLAGSGLRISELLSLPRYDFEDFFGNWNGKDDMIVSVVGKRSRIRTIPILGEYLAPLQLYLSMRDDSSPALFVSHGHKHSENGGITRQTAWRHISARASLLGLSSFIAPHAFRHYYLEKLANGNIDLRILADIAGHSDIRVTHQSYMNKVNAKRMAKSIREALDGRQ